MGAQVRVRAHVGGIVQGVGFRPFVYRIAIKRGLSGFVRNLGDAGVEIEVEGPAERVHSFLSALRDEAPPLSEICELRVEERPLTGEKGFFILPSRDGGEGGGTIPPDIATCDQCLSDIEDPESRYHRYWATSCTNCGPRFTVIEALPYDRPRTAFRDFPMCEGCRREYQDPLDRRYHAQTIACPACGPELFYLESGREVPGDPIAAAAAALREGKIVAIKGIGGTHLACDATREEAVAELRRRLARPGQPYALMATSHMIERFASPTEEEWKLLRSPRRPIVVLGEKPGYLAPSVAPGLHTVGVMLPYSGLHHLLFKHINFPLVMTSANFPGRPMLTENEEILAELPEVADGFLLHNRRIVARCDDSVVRFAAGVPVFLRRSRGWVPQPIPLDLGEEPLLALGGELNVAFALYHRGKVFLSQHIGNLDHLDTLEFLKEAIRHLLSITGAPMPKWIACDLHPGFATTRMAEELGERVIQVQHHVAHVAGLGGEHGLPELVGIAIDGYGYGEDGAAWGGEVIVWRRGACARAGSLAPVPMPGGDLATLRPGRMAASYLVAAGLDPQGSGLSPRELAMVRFQIERGLNCPLTTSAGRFLDAVAAWLGIAKERTYEGEPAMRLEAAAAAGKTLPLEPVIEERDGRLILNTVALFRKLHRLRKEGASTADLAATAQAALARGLSRIAIGVAREEGIGAVGLTGGAAVNDRIASAVKKEVEKAGLRFLCHREVPPGDGGLSFGQLVQVAHVLSQSRW
ncbi:TPA: carbamoyltransferase HypF [Candidatus Acetothermia bacterium]|nr:carbamoyltransferase HypF [Candidatus Acetothermia bacterium]